MSWITNIVTKNISDKYRESISDEIEVKLFKVRSETNSIIRNSEESSRIFLGTLIGELRGDLERKFCKELEKFKQDESWRKQVIEVKLLPKGEINELEGVFHEEFKTVLELVSLDLPVFLSGPAGSGKNVTCKQVADALSLEFHFTNAVTQEYKLTGFIDANGVYHETEFYRSFKNGGLFFLDEIDASIPEVLVILNAAIANRYFEFPIGKVEAHPNFRIIAAGNTFGTGADSTYTGRYQLDGASLDRFSIVDINYSETIEKYITEGNTELIEFCHEFRKVANNSGINCIFSYRALKVITQLESRLPLPKIFKMCITKGLSSDDISTLINKLGDSCRMNRYFDAFTRII